MPIARKAEKRRRRCAGRGRASRAALGILVACTLVTIEGSVAAEEVEAPPAAPAYPPTAPRHDPPAAPPPARPYYAPSPRAYGKPPPTLPYREGQPIPHGYRLEEKPIKGLVVAGYVVTGVPYGIGLLAASGAEFRNESAWLGVPFVGPWLTLGFRDYVCEEHRRDDNEESLECLGEVFLTMGLIVDGIMQTTGGVLLLVGYTATKQKLVLEENALWIRPMRVGSGGGLAIEGLF